MSTRSTQLIVLGVLAQSGAGLWLLTSDASPGTTTVSDLFAGLLGGGVIVLAVIAGLVALAAAALLSLVGVPRLAALTTLAIGGLFLGLGTVSPIFWVLPVFFLGAAVAALRPDGGDG